MKLLLCPFCGSEAEIDTNQRFCAFPSGRLETAISIYCRECTAAITVCKSDVPSIRVEEVEEMWNRRVLISNARETIARMINPSSWRVMDSYLADVKRKHPNGGYDPDNFQDRESLALADQIIAMLAA